MFSADSTHNKKGMSKKEKVDTIYDTIYDE